MSSFERFAGMSFAFKRWWWWYVVTFGTVCVI